MSANNHLQKSLEDLKASIVEMADLIHVQLNDVIKVLSDGSSKHAEMILSREKRINEKELLIDSDCEKILALYGPVATDLRLVLSVIEMNTHLERLGDLAEGVALSIEGLSKSAIAKIPDQVKLVDHVGEIIKGLDLCMQVFDEEDISKTADVFLINKNIRKDIRTYKPIFIEIIQDSPKSAEKILAINQSSRLVSRMSDMIDNVAEEIVFYIEAKVLKHKKKKHHVVRKHIKEKGQTGSDTPVSD